MRPQRTLVISDGTSHSRHVLDIKEISCLISPSLRRVVYLGEDTSRAVDSLNTEITLLKVRVSTLKRDKDLPMDRCETAQSAVPRPTPDERTARLELIKAAEEVRQANVGFELLKVAYRSLESGSAPYRLSHQPTDTDWRLCQTSGLYLRHQAREQLSRAQLYHVD